jgi:adenylylsulfate kinase-like enzyme
VIEPLPPLLLTGGPAVGKTTTARALADAVFRTAYLDVDHLRHLVRNGHAAPWDGEDGAAQQLLGVRNAAGLARNFLASGFNVVVTDVVTSATLAVYRELLADVVVVHLLVSLAEARRRARTRPVYLTNEEFEALHQDQSGLVSVDHRLDVTQLDPAEQLRQVRTIWTPCRSDP